MSPLVATSASGRPNVRIERSAGVLWRERWIRLRNRAIQNPRFQRWAAGFPLTRGLVRRRARALFDVVAGFVYSQVLSACVRLRLFDTLNEGPQTVGRLADRLGLSEPACERLLKAAAALELAERLADGRFALGHLGAALRGNPAVCALVDHHDMLYADLADPVRLLRGEAGATRLASFWPYAGHPNPAGLTSDTASAYSALMSASQPLVAGEILDTYPLARHRCLLDIGGGEGAFLAAAAARAPALRLMLFDLPAVRRLAVTRLEAAGLGQRATVVGGNFLADELPRGADVATLIRVVHDHSDADVVDLFRRVRRALSDDGVLLVAEPMSGTAGAAPIGDAYFGFYLAAMGRGRPRSADEIVDLLRQAGFQRVREAATRTPLLVRLLVAH